jgi:hypothetical protein
MYCRDACLPVNILCWTIMFTGMLVMKPLFSPNTHCWCFCPPIVNKNVNRLLLGGGGGGGGGAGEAFPLLPLSFPPPNPKG